MMDTFLQRAGALDAADQLARFHELFHVPEGKIYLDGNSLGLMPKACAARVQGVLHNEWSEGLISSWSGAGWFHLPMTVGDRIAPIVGAGEKEIAVGDSTSVNLFKCLAAALKLQEGRKVILSEADNFPTDHYIASGLADMMDGYSVRDLNPGDDLAKKLDEKVAVLILSHVHYKTCEIRDVKAINQAAHDNGVLVLWDLSHTSGAVEINLKADDCDFAVGCTYKYLNGGPGAPAFAWINPRLQEKIQQPLSGWMGHFDPFAFTPDYQPAHGARRFVCGTPQVLSLSSLDEALKLWSDVDRDALFAKSRAMTSFFIEAVETVCADYPLTLVCPRDASKRGSHVSFDYENGYGAMRAMADRGVTGDFRAPKTMRFGFAPLYLSFADVANAVGHLKVVLDGQEWDREEYKIRGEVT
ncbi:kynureninase [Ruegeria sp.]|uniref:kynureninase n=1 Tax=Ruegeria sp. TaxID=1879320 RepID=UPI003B0059C4